MWSDDLCRTVGIGGSCGDIEIVRNRSGLEVDQLTKFNKREVNSMY